MPVYYEWTSSKSFKCKPAGYSKFDVSNHPLKVFVTVKSSPSKSLVEKINKWSSAFEEIDPLLRFEQMNSEEEAVLLMPNESVNFTKAWHSKRTIILNKYTTGEKLTIVSSFLPGGEKALIRQVSNLNEKVKHRLEQLDEFDESTVRKTMGLSQQDFVSKINLLSDEIKKAWVSEQRVKAFKIAIQCSKLLSDINVMPFYPSKFVLIIDILETFGNLVFDRLRAKSFGDKNTLSLQEIDSNNVPESAKETCQNWIYKMASIRELLPRLFLEMSLLKCYVFLSKEEIRPALIRLTMMIRGIGNPLVAVYLRMHVCNVATKILGKGSEEIFYENFKEFLDEYQQIFCPMMKKKYEAQLLTMDKYLSLYIPAVDWLLYGTLNSNRCKETLLQDFLQQCKEMPCNELLLCCLVSAFDSKSIINKSSDILGMIQSSSDKMVMVHEVLTSLGEHLCSADVYSQVASESLIKTWWKIASNLASTNNFLQVLEPWIQFACTHLSTQHVNIILRGTIRYVIKCGKPADEYAGNLQFVIKRMLKSIPDVQELFLIDAFMPLLELVQTSNARTLVAKTVLSMFFSRYNAPYIDDHIVISSLMRLCCILHDSINAVTVDDESKLCAELIIKYVQAVTYHEDLEQQLNFYVDCRSAFIKLDEVLIALVQAVNAVGARVEGAHGRWLQRACSAYSFITIPSLHCSLTKAQLYLLSGQVALLNNCIGQAEANFKALVGLIPDIPEYILEDTQKKPTNIKLGAIIDNFLSTLILLPDNIDSNCKGYILSGFIKTMERIHWNKTDYLYYNTLLHILELLSVMAREKYPYHIDSVISNDELYGSDLEFIQALDKYASNICQELLIVIKTLGDENEPKKQYNLALQFLWTVLTKGELKETPMHDLAKKLWTVLQRLQPNDKTANMMLTTLRNSNTEEAQSLLREILENNK